MAHDNLWGIIYACLSEILMQRIMNVNVSYPKPRNPGSIRCHLSHFPILANNVAWSVWIYFNDLSLILRGRIETKRLESSKIQGSLTSKYIPELVTLGNDGVFFFCPDTPYVGKSPTVLWKIFWWYDLKMNPRGWMQRECPDYYLINFPAIPRFPRFPWNKIKFFR